MKILLITSLYPTLDKVYTVTPVCHYFAKEWIREGHKVRVINLTSRYPWIINQLAKPFISLIKARTGFSIYTNSPKISNEYELEGINVLNIPIEKTYPHQYPSAVKCKGIAQEIHDYLEKCNFYPDIITGHIINPALSVIHCLKDYYDCKTCIVSHTYLEDLHRAPFDCSDFFKSIDIWGFRSTKSFKRFNLEYGDKYKSFVCHSGIPESYISKYPKHYKNKVLRLCYLGSLFKLKKVDLIIHTLKHFNNKELSFSVIGNGSELKKLQKLTNDLDLQNQVKFYGRQERSSAQQLLSESDCFVMISQEAFGLVYLEAMAKGLITIGLKNSGIDGVIKDGVNGFLCESQTVDSLLNTLERVFSLDVSQLEKISNNARLTVMKMTDSKMAIKYIRQIEIA